MQPEKRFIQLANVYFLKGNSILKRVYPKQFVSFPNNFIQNYLGPLSRESSKGLRVVISSYLKNRAQICQKTLNLFLIDKFVKR